MDMITDIPPAELLAIPDPADDHVGALEILATCERWQVGGDLVAAAELIRLVQRHLLPHTIPGYRHRRRRALLERDGRKCYLCGRPLNRHTVTIDHVVPLARGGRDTPDNIRAACKPCNQHKSDLTLDEYLERRAQEVR